MPFIFFDIYIALFDMEIYRKYFGEKQLQSLLTSEPTWGVNIFTVGHHVHLPKKHYPDVQHPSSHYFSWEKGRRLSEYQLVYIANGKGLFETEVTEVVSVGAGSLILLFPNVWHRYRPSDETGWEEFWVGFDGHFAEYLMRQDCFNPDKPVLEMGFNVEFLNIFIRLIETIKHENIAFRQISSCFVIQMLGLVYASALLNEKPNNRLESIIGSIRYKIHQEWNEALDMEKLAQEQKISYALFRKSFKEILGISPGQYHLNLKIEKAALMLKETDYSIAMVAQKAGFESEFYFSRIFKKKMGISPGKWRKK